MGICYLALYKPMLFFTLLFEELFLKLLTVLGTPNYYVVTIQVDLLIFLQPINMLIYKRVGFQVFFWPCSGLLFLAFFLYSSLTSLYSCIQWGSSMLYSRFKKERKKKERELWLMKKEKVQQLHSLCSSLVNLSITCLELAYVLAPPILSPFVLC